VPGYTEQGVPKTDEKQATLSIEVTPKITPDGYVQLDIVATDDTLVPGTSGASAVVDKKSLKTKALVKNGETLVLGGIYKTTTIETEEGIPLLSRIPLLGWLFKTQTQKGPDVTELLIFITPTIVTKP
jgi:type IV pilus assembly protein PilQ